MCIRCQVALRAADAAMLLCTDWTWSNALLTRCFTCLGCTKLTKQTLNYLHLPFGVCNSFCSQATQIVHDEAIATCRMPKLYIKTTQGMLLYVHLCIKYVYSVAIPGLLAQLHAMQTLPGQRSHMSQPSVLLSQHHLSDHILLDRQPRLSFTQTTLQKAFSKASTNALNKTHTNTG